MTAQITHMRRANASAALRAQKRQENVSCPGISCDGDKCRHRYHEMVRGRLDYKPRERKYLGACAIYAHHPRFRPKAAIQPKPALRQQWTLPAAGPPTEIGMEQQRWMIATSLGIDMPASIVSEEVRHNWRLYDRGECRYEVCCQTYPGVDRSNKGAREVGFARFALAVRYKRSAHKVGEAGRELRTDPHHENKTGKCLISAEQCLTR
jgi:hypothetical protein